MLDAEMYCLDVMFLVVNGGKLFAAAFVVAGNLFARVIFRVIAFPGSTSNFPIVRIGRKRRRRIAR